MDVIALRGILVGGSHKLTVSVDVERVD